MISDVIAVQKIVDSAVGIERFAYPANKNAKRPAGEYAIVKQLSDRAIGFDEVRNYEDPVTGKFMMKVSGLRVVEYAIMFSRDDEEVVRFDQGLYTPKAQDAWREFGHVVMWKERIDNKTLALETTWEVRSGLILRCNVKRELITEVDQIKHIIAEGTVADGTKDYSLKIDVDATGVI